MGKKIRASHILCSTDVNSPEDALTTIKKIKTRLDAGDDFEVLAREFSDCPSKERGGDLGYFERGRMVEKFDEAAFQLQTDTISDVLETEFGYHIIYRTS